MLWLQTAGFASAVEKIYTGCERVMERIARHIDNKPIDHAHAWHAELLTRMKSDFPPIRKSVVSEETYQVLDRLRGFRHRERNSYGNRLGPDIVALRTDEAIKLVEIFWQDIASWKQQMLPNHTSDPSAPIMK
jgi:hypothetical protein